MKGKLKKIGLAICASNYERQKKNIEAIHQRLLQEDNCALYVITNYGIYYDEDCSSNGESADYSLFETIELDGCLLESNLGCDTQVNNILDILNRRNIPAVLINIKNDKAPYVSLRAEGSIRELFEHLIVKHGCRKINLCSNVGGMVFTDLSARIYRETLEKHNIPYDENRISFTKVGTDKGKEILDIFESRDVFDDAEAIVCEHDVNAISLCIELENRGIKVPDDIIIASINRSNNSISFMPDITGVDRMDSRAATLACNLLFKLIDGESVDIENYYEGKVSYGHSCGCDASETEQDERVAAFRNLTLNKIDAGRQIGGMMQFMNSLETTETQEQFANAVGNMLLSTGCNSYFFCANSSDIEYMIGNKEEDLRESPNPYDDEMLLIRGYCERTGVITNKAFALKDLLPIEIQPGDMLLVLPVHHMQRQFGYMVYLNEYLPLYQYNFRICHDIIGNNVENLRRKLLLKHNVDMLDTLYMQDQLTHLYNRFAFMRYSDRYGSRKNYSLAMLDMDGLKYINDNFGHQDGNLAITMLASLIVDSVRKDDLVVRYGGDEFVVLSFCTDHTYWDNLLISLNEKLLNDVKEQNLPYPIGVSLGYSISTRQAPLPIDEALKNADEAMYKVKAERKKNRAK